MSELSEEERKAIDELWHFDCVYNREIKIVLNLIKKQAEELNKLKEEKAIRSWVHIKENGEVEPLFYISKDKIKAKIAECREILYSFEKELELKANKDKFIHKESMNCLLGQISILQSLLEEE